LSFARQKRLVRSHSPEMEEGALLVVRCAAGAAFEEARVRVPLEATVAELKKRLMAQRGQAAAAPSEQKVRERARPGAMQD